MPPYSATHVDGPFVMTVNISARQLREPDFVDTVANAVTAMNGAELVLEITERQGIEIDPVVLGAMHAIAAMGVRFAIDDFGVGFSSISYLRDIPVQIIKADGSLSGAIDSDERASALLRSVAHMGQSLGLDVIVEGIEREAQMAMLRDYDHKPLRPGLPPAPPHDCRKPAGDGAWRPYDGRALRRFLTRSGLRPEIGNVPVVGDWSPTTGTSAGRSAHSSLVRSPP